MGGELQTGARTKTPEAFETKRQRCETAMLAMIEERYSTRRRSVGIVARAEAAPKIAWGTVL